MTTPADPSDQGSDVYHSGRKPLDAIFSPRSVAVVGATEKAGSVGRTVLRNLISNPFGGTVYPVNPKRPNVLGVKAYPTIKDLPEVVDLAVIVTPAPTVPGLIGECADAGIKGAIVISAGFKETGPDGMILESQVLEQARRGRIRLIGPNCLGVMRPFGGLNATFAGSMARPGSVGFISQSGALTTAILDWSLRTQVGFSAFISIGSMLDVGWGDLIDYLGDDPRTRSIVIYMESVGDARAFLSAAREVALTKPIIVIKAGRTEAAAKAAASHTGSLAGSDEVLDAAFRRGGVLRANTISDVFYLAEVLGKQPRAKGPKLTIVTNAGGPGVLAVDALIGNGGQLAELSPRIARRSRRVPARALEPRQSDRRPGRCRPGSLRQSPRSGGQRPGLRRPARGPDPPGDDRPDPHRRGPQALRQNRGEAGPGLVDGRGGGRRRDLDPRPGGHPDVPLSRHRGPASSPAWPATPTTSGPSTRPRPSRPNPTTRPSGRPEGTRSSRPPGTNTGPCSTRSSRSNCSSPTACRWSRPAWRPPRARPSRRPRRSASRSSSSSIRGRSPTNPTSAASGSTCSTLATSRKPTGRSRRASTRSGRPTRCWA